MGRPCRGGAVTEGLTAAAGGRTLPAASGSGASPLPEGRAGSARGSAERRVWVLAAELAAGCSVHVAVVLARSHRRVGGGSGCGPPQTTGYVLVSVCPSLCRPHFVSERSVFSNKLSALLLPRPPGFCFVDVGGFLL